MPAHMPVPPFPSEALLSQTRLPKLDREFDLADRRPILHHSMDGLWHQTKESPYAIPLLVRSIRMHSAHWLCDERWWRAQVAL